MSKKRAYEQGAEFEAEPEPEEAKATLQEFADFFYSKAITTTNPTEVRNVIATWLSSHGIPKPTYHSVTGQYEAPTS